MKLTGYSDRWSAGPGDTIIFYVSSELPEYTAALVRLIHGDDNPRGPGPKEVPVASALAGRYPGKFQPIYPGSYVRVDRPAAFDAAQGFTVMTWVKPSAPGRGLQGIFSQWDAVANRGFGLFLNGEQGLELWLGAAHKLALGVPLRTTEWTFVAAGFDPAGGRAFLYQHVGRFTLTAADQSARTEAACEAPAFAADAPLTMAAGWLAQEDGRRNPAACYNGKLEGPRLFDRVLSAAELEAAAADALPPDLLRHQVAAWDFAHGMAGCRIPDGTGRGLDGMTVNRPMRALTAHHWRPESESFHDAPDQYKAIHFHDDDLADAAWAESFRLQIPDDLKSGVYAVKLTGADGARDYLPFFVRPPRGTATAPIAVLMPTVSYMAYANECLLDLQELGGSTPMRNRTLHPAEYAYINRYHLRSTYDYHRDGTGVCYSSMLRPILASFRPYHRCRSFDAPHQFAADLYIIDWLEQKGFAYDVITDHDLHREGGDLLKPYRAIISGSHAEYWTAAMLDGLEGYQAQGGRFICLSGNGLYWVTGLDPDNQTVCEVRRANGSRTWATGPGENHLSFTGEHAGLWRLRGRPPQKYTGVGTAGVGFDRGAPYRRRPESYDPRTAFIFEGVDGDMIGDFPVLALNYGAAGFEIDRADVTLGTPVHALVVASSTGYSDNYQPAMEEAFALVPYQNGLFNPNIRTDMVFYELPHDGAVFSVGAVTFCSALSYNNYNNSASRVLENVVRAFSRTGPIRS